MCPSQAQAKRLSRNAHLLSIRLEQAGLRSTACGVRSPGAVKKCCGFLELQIDHVIGFGKALRSPPVRNCELHRTSSYEELLRVRRSARSATAENRGSGGNRKNKPDPTHLGLDPVANGVESE